MSAILYKDNPYGGTTSVMDASHILVEQGSETVTAQSKFNTYTTTIQRILGNFATVEESAIASKAYGIGDYIILNSFLYKVKTAIEVGDPIDNTVGGNVVKTNVGDEFKTFEFPVREMVKAQYDALPEATKNDGTMYMITDDNAGWEAESVEYDNTESGLTADNLQDAVDEVVTKIDSYSLGDSGTQTLTKFGGTVRYRKLNGIVTVVMENTALSGMTANADNVMGNLPEPYRPGRQMVSAHWNGGYTYVSGVGNVVVHPTATSQNMGFCYTYVVG